MAVSPCGTRGGAPGYERSAAIRGQRARVRRQGDAASPDATASMPGRVRKTSRFGRDRSSPVITSGRRVPALAASALRVADERWSTKITAHDRRRADDEQDALRERLAREGGATHRYAPSRVRRGPRRHRSPAARRSGRRASAVSRFTSAPSSKRRREEHARAAAGRDSRCAPRARSSRGDSSGARCRRREHPGLARRPG